MNLQSMKSGLRDNWYLAALFVGMIAAGLFLQLRGGNDTTASAAAASDAGTAKAAPLAQETPGRPSPQEVTRAVIAKHKAKLEETPSDKDAPALLNAMGNLYRQRLVDYPNAIQCYERLLHDYPNWEGIRSAYISLADCYRRQEDHEGLRRTYDAMTKYFPPDSQEYQYAKAQLSY